MPTMFRKRKDANEETMAMGRVVGVRNASPAHRVAQLHEREGEAAIITVEELARRVPRNGIGRTAPGTAPGATPPTLVDRHAGPERVHKHHNIKKGTRWVPFDKATTQKLEDAGSSAQIKFRGAPIHW